MSRRIACLVFLAFGVSSCSLLDGKCTYETRTLAASGVVNENGADLATAQITLSEERGSIQGTWMHWLISGTTLKGHVLSAALKDASDLSVVRLNLPLSGGAQPQLSEGAADTNTGANLGGVHDFLGAGRGVIELQTDSPSRPTITIPLTPQSQGDWLRPNCS